MVQEDQPEHVLCGHFLYRKCNRNAKRLESDMLQEKMSNDEIGKAQGK